MFSPRKSVLKRIAFGTDVPKVYDVRGIDETWSVELQTLEGHKRPVHSVSVCPGTECHLIASGSEDNTVNLWDAQTGQLSLSLHGHAHTVMSVALSPDGRVVASGSHDRTIKLWDSSTGGLVHTIKADDDPSWVNSVAFSPDRTRRLLASGYHNGAIKVWDCGMGDWGMKGWTISKPICLQGVSDSISCVVFSPYDKNRILASASYDGTIRFWNFGQGGSARKGEMVSMFKTESTLITCISFSPDPKNQLLASVSSRGSIKIWDFNHRTDVAYACLEGHVEYTSSVTFLPGPKSRTVASGSRDGKITIWDYGKKLHRTFRGHSKEVKCLIFSETPSGRRLISSSHDWTIKVWDLEAMELHRPATKYQGTISHLQFSPDGQHLASYSNDENANQTVTIWNTATGEVHTGLEGHSDQVLCLAFLPATDVQLLASGSRDKSIKLWNYQMGEHVNTMDVDSEENHGITCVAFSPDSQLLASCTGRTINLWNAHTHEPILDLEKYREQHRGEISHLVFSPNSRLLVSGSVDRTIKVWDCHSRTLIHNLRGHTDRILSISFSPDSQMLASVGREGAVRIWNLHPVQRHRLVAEHYSRATSVAFSPDGKWLAFSCLNGTIKIWKTSSVGHEAEPHQTLERHSRFIWSAGSLLISVQDHGWLCFDGERMLWLPSEYRRARLAANIHGLIALSNSHGRVCFISIEQVMDTTSKNQLHEGRPDGDVVTF